jgi:hypothetical protein
MGQIETRENIKKRFQNGALPSQGDFAVLVDSLVHVDEFSEWTTHGVIDVGSEGGRRWRLECPDGRQLVIRLLPGTTQPAGSGAPVATQLRVDAWVGMPARRGTYQPASDDRTRDGAVPDGGPPGALHVKADGGWHPIVRSVAVPAAFEVVAQTAQEGRGDDSGVDRIFGNLGLRGARAGVAHAIAVTAGKGSTPSLTQTVAPLQQGRGRLRIAAVVGAVVALLVAVYAAYRVPGTVCGESWGIMSCVPPFISAQPGLLGVAAVLVALATTLGVLARLTERNCLQLAWRRSSQGDTYDLCVRAPLANNSEVYYHLTRLW